MYDPPPSPDDAKWADVIAAMVITAVAAWVVVGYALDRWTSIPAAWVFGGLIACPLEMAVGLWVIRKHGLGA